jgi:hypothetical protein
MSAMNITPNANTGDSQGKLVGTDNRKLMLRAGLGLAVVGAVAVGATLLQSGSAASASGGHVSQALRADFNVPHTSEVKQTSNLDPGGVGLFGACVPEGDGVKNFDGGSQYRCTGNRYDPPATYLNVREDAGDMGAQYDLAIIGSGVQTAYLVEQLRQRLGSAADGLKIGIFEQRHQSGGRLMSAYGPGSLAFGASSSPATDNNPPPEYGGMRMDPLNHPLIWDAMAQVAATKGKVCKRSGPLKKVGFSWPDLANQWQCRGMPMELGQLGTACTDPKTGYMTDMYQSDLRYYTGGSVADYGTYLKNEARVKRGSSSEPEDLCLGLTQLTQDYVDRNASAKVAANSIGFTTLVDQMCDNCATATQPFNLGGGKTKTACDVCNRFPRPGLNLVSCIGYDDLPTVSGTVALTEAAAVVGRGAFNCQKNLGSTAGCSYLYMAKTGLQMMAQDMLFNEGVTPRVGVNFGKQLIGLEYEGGNTAAMANKQAAAAAAATTKDTLNWNDPSTRKTIVKKEGFKPVKLSFADGSVIRAKAVYMTQLPVDLVKTKNFEGYAASDDSKKINFAADKFFLTWENGLPAELGASFGADDLDGGVDGRIRLVMDGGRPGWITRQVWYWDPNTVLVYQTATTKKTDPSNVMQEMIQKEGMTATTKKVMKEISEAFFGPQGKQFPLPTWGRVKGWAEGSLAYYNSNVPAGPGVSSSTPTSYTGGLAGLPYATHIMRPLGAEAPVFYGSSEASGSGGNGWMEGSLEFVYTHLPTIAQFLTSGGTVLGPDPKGC